MATREARAIIEQLSQEIGLMHAQVSNKSQGSDLQMLAPMVKAMEIVTTALSLPNIGSAPLFLSLNIASIGIYTTESHTGVIGKSMERLMGALSKGIGEALMPEINPASRQLLTLLIRAGFTFLIILSTQTASKGIGQFPKHLEAVDTQLAHLSYFELALLLINSSGLLEMIFETLIKACGGNEKSQKMGALILAQLGNLLMILSGTYAGSKSPESLIAEDEERLNQGIRAVTESIERLEREKFGDQALVLTLTIKQLYLALKAKDYSTFFNILNSLLHSLETSTEELFTDIQMLNQSINTLMEITSQSNDEQPFTSIMNVI